jgi:hypothetical protein
MPSTFIGQIGSQTGLISWRLGSDGSLIFGLTVDAVSKACPAPRPAYRPVLTGILEFNMRGLCRQCRYLGYLVPGWTGPVDSMVSTFKGSSFVMAHEQPIPAETLGTNSVDVDLPP